MKTNGLCYNPDTLCQQEWMNHPLTYYRVKMRDTEKRGQQSAPQPAQSRGQPEDRSKEDR